MIENNLGEEGLLVSSIVSFSHNFFRKHFILRVVQRQVFFGMGVEIKDLFLLCSLND